MIQAKAMAHALTGVALVFYVLCALIAFLTPDLFFGIVNSWFHGINLELVRATMPMSFGTFLLGVITFGAFVWIVTYAVISVYNRLVKK